MDGDKDKSARLTQEEIRFLLGARDYEPLPSGLEGAVSPERNGEGIFSGTARLPALLGKKTAPLDVEKTVRG